MEGKIQVTVEIEGLAKSLIMSAKYEMVNNNICVSQPANNANEIGLVLRDNGIEVCVVGHEINFNLWCENMSGGVFLEFKTQDQFSIVRTSIYNYGETGRFNVKIKKVEVNN